MELVPTPRPPYRWWHAAAVGLTANAATALLSRAAGVGDQPTVYRWQRKPKIAPPSWAFGPAWTINNVASLWAGLRLANLPPGTPGRRAALGLEAAGWALYAAFTPLYFGLRSPILGAAVTAADLGVTAASAAVAARLDRKAAAGLAPRLAWLGLASYVAIYMARRNPDRLLHRWPRR